MKELQQYTYTIPANGSVQIPAANDNFIIQASTGPLAVRGNTFGRMRGLVAGQGFKQVPFDRLELFDESGAPNTVTLLMSPAEFVNQVFSGSVVIVGALALDAATIAALTQASYGASFDSVAALAATSVEAVFLAAANVNGAVIKAASWSGQNAGTPVTSSGLIAHTAAPAAFTSGDVLMQLKNDAVQGGGAIAYSGSLDREIFVPAGKGVWFWNQTLEAVGARRVLYTLL